MSGRLEVVGGSFGNLIDDEFDHIRPFCRVSASRTSLALRVDDEAQVWCSVFVVVAGDEVLPFSLNGIGIFLWSLLRWIERNLDFKFGMATQEEVSLHTLGEILGDISLECV